MHAQVGDALAPDRHAADVDQPVLAPPQQQRRDGDVGQAGFHRRAGAEIAEDFFQLLTGLFIALGDGIEHELRHPGRGRHGHGVETPEFFPRMNQKRVVALGQMPLKVTGLGRGDPGRVDQGHGRNAFRVSGR
ncbi:hypothetical protein D3C84_738220 [compost metagenome]